MFFFTQLSSYDITTRHQVLRPSSTHRRAAFHISLFYGDQESARACPSQSEQSIFLFLMWDFFFYIKRRHQYKTTTTCLPVHCLQTLSNIPPWNTQRFTARALKLSTTKPCDGEHLEVTAAVIWPHSVIPYQYLIRLSLHAATPPRGQSFYYSW